MFAAVFYTADKSVDVVNKKKIHPVDAACDKLSVGASAKVQYLTEDIDESGREIRSIKDFDGIIVFLGNARGEAEAFAAEQRERLRDAFESDGNSGIVKFALEHHVDSDDPKPRRRKKTTKLQEFEDEMRGTSQSESESARDTRDQSSASHSTITSIEAKTKKPKEKGQSKKPSKATIEKQKSVECQKLQTMEYFKKKKAILDMNSGSDKIVPPSTCISNITPATNTSSSSSMPKSPSKDMNSGSDKIVPPSTCISNITPATNTSSSSSMPKSPSKDNLVQTPVKSPTCTVRWNSSPPKTPDMCINLTGPVLRSSTKKRRLIDLEEDNAMYFDNQCHQQRQPFIFGSSATTSVAVGQGLDVLNGCFNFGCRQRIDAMEQDAIGYRYRINSLEAENNELRRQRNKCEATASDLSLLRQLKMLVEQWETENTSRQNLQHLQDQSPFADVLCQPFPSCSHSESPMMSEKLSTPKLKVVGKDVSRQLNVSTPNTCSTASTAVDEGEEEEFSQFFGPGDGKVLLSDGHQIYINETKLALMRKKALKSESRMTRCLLDYFFAPKYLAVHSATGEKSTKPALPGKITLAIKAYLLQCFRTCDASLNAIINRKCLDSKRVHAVKF